MTFFLQEKEALKDGEGVDDDGWQTVPLKKTITQKPENTKDQRLNKKLEKKKRKEKVCLLFRWGISCRREGS